MKIKNLEEIAEIRAGYPTPKNKDFFKDGIYDFIKTSDVGKIKIGSIKSSLTKLNKFGVNKFKPFKKGTILFPKSGMSTILNHRVIMEKEGYIASTLAGIKADENLIHDRYLFYFLMTVDTKKLIPESAYPGMNLSQIQKIKIPLPTLTEQQHIVAKLEAVFTEIDMAIDIEKRKEKEAIQLYRAISSKIFFKDEKKVSLNSVAKIIMGQSPKGESYNTDGEGVPLINGPVEFDKNSFGRSKSIKFTTKPTKFCEEGDALLCVRGSTTGRMNIANEKACIGRGVAAIRAKENQEWINYFIQSSRDYIYSIGTGATFPNVSSKQIEKIQIHFPDINEQKKLVKKLKEAYRHVTNMSDVIQQSLKNYKKLKSAVLNQTLLSKII